MERFSSKLIFGTVFCAGLLAQLGCNRSDRATISRLDQLEQSAHDAEQADEELSRLKEQAAEQAAGVELEAKLKATNPEKVEKTDKPAKAAPAPKETAAVKGKPAPQKTNRQPASKAGAVVYVVQAGAFKLKENAEGFHNRLKNSGFPVFLHQLNHSKNGPLFLVRFEPTKSVEEANARIKSLKEKSAVDAQLIRLTE